MKYLVYLLLICIIYKESSPLLATTTAISLRQPIVDSIQREQIKKSHIRSSIEMVYCADKANLMKLRKMTTTKYDLVGNATIIVEKDFLINGSDSTILKHDFMGNILEAVVFDSSGSIKGSDFHSFNIHGKLLESKYLDKVGAVWCKKNYLYNAEGREILETSWARDWSSWRYTRRHAYDSLGNCVYDSSQHEIEKAVFDKDRNMIRRQTIYSTDTSLIVYRTSKTEREECLNVDVNGKFNNRIIKHFDNNGRIVEIKWEDFSGKTTLIMESSYDDSGMTERSKSINMSDATDYIYRRYDSQHHLLESSISDSTGHIRNREIKQFDNNGNIVLNDRWSESFYYGSKDISHILFRWNYEYYDH